MKAVIQRVLYASVTVTDKKTSEIGAGLLIFLGVAQEDMEKDMIRSRSRKPKRKLTKLLKEFEKDGGVNNMKSVESISSRLRNGNQSGITGCFAKFESQFQDF